MTRVLTPEQDRFVGVIKARVDRLTEEFAARLLEASFRPPGLLDAKGNPLHPPQPSGLAECLSPKSGKYGEGPSRLSEWLPPLPPKEEP